MHLDLIQGPLEWAGASWLSEQPNGVQPHRLPRRYLDQLSDVASSRTNAASGVRLVFESDTPFVELRCWLRSLTADLELQTPHADLLVNGEFVETCVCAHADGVPGPDGASYVFRFDGLVPGPKTIEIWLPHNAVAIVQALALEDGSVVSAPRADERPVWVHHGSSISHCGEADSPTRTWPARVSRHAELNLRSLGFAGECQIDQFAARTVRDLDADIISLEVGVNVVNGATMRERTFVSALHGFLDTVRDGHPTTPIVVMSPIVFPIAERLPGPTRLRDGSLKAIGDVDELAWGALTIERVRELIEAVVAHRVGESDSRIFYLDGLRILGHEDSALLPDGLHPNDAGYGIMAERFSELVFGPDGLVGTPVN